MKELIAIIILLMLFSAAKGEAPAYFNKGDGAEAAYTQQTGDVYAVGVDIQQGMYTFMCSDDAAGMMTITNWDGSIAFQQQVYSGWVETMHVYNEQTIYLPEGVQGEYHFTLASSAYDTGTRQLRTEQAGSYAAGKELQPGLYIVQNENAASADVRIRDAGGALIREWRLMPDSYYAIHLKDGWSVEIGEGCLLRSMTTKYIFQEGTDAVVPGSRYITGMQIPRRTYTVMGRDHTSCITVLDMASGEEEKIPLARGEQYVLECGFESERELLIEMVNLDISWEAGIG